MHISDLWSTIDSYWASVLDCDADAFRNNASTIVRTEKSPGLTALSVSPGYWVLSVIPELPDSVVRAIGSTLEQADLADPHVRRNVHQQLADHKMADMYGPSELLYITADAFRPLPPVNYRQLTSSDAAVADRFRVGMGGTVDWKLGMPQEWPYVIGLFEADELIAVGAVHNWDDVIGETYVDTLPAHRGKGLANRLTSETTRWILEESSLIAQAGGEIINPAAGRISRRLGYELYGTLVMNNLCRRS